MDPREQLVSKWQMAVHDLETCHEQQVYQEVQALRDTFEVFKGNMEEFISFDDAVTRKPEFWLTENRERLSSAMREYVRLFHNFLASSLTLIDHTRVVVKHLYEDAPWIDDYRERVLKLAQDPFACLVRDLRVYIQHYSLPVVQTHTTVRSDQTLSRSFGINLAKVRQWDRWSAPAKRKLDSTKGDNLSTQVLVLGYYAVILKLHQWLWHQQAAFHKRDLETLNEKHRRVLEAESALSQYDAGNGDGG